MSVAGVINVCQEKRECRQKVGAYYRQPFVWQVGAYLLLKCQPGDRKINGQKEELNSEQIGNQIWIIKNIT